MEANEKLVNTWSSEYPAFRPDYSPVFMFKCGIFEGRYFNEPQIVQKFEDVVPKQFIDAFEEDLNYFVINKTPAVSINKFKVVSGSTYKQWIEGGWIRQQDPFGWVNWYINFYYGRRSKDDLRQVKRWVEFKARHFGTLRRTGTIEDISHGHKTRQNMLHWGIDSTKQ